MYRVGWMGSLFGGLATLRILRQATQIHRFRCAEEKSTEHQKTAFRLDGVRIPIFTVPLLGVFWALKGLQVGPGRALGRARRREERTLVLTWQGIARMDIGMDEGHSLASKSSPEGTLEKKPLPQTQKLI